MDRTSMLIAPAIFALVISASAFTVEADVAAGFQKENPPERVFEAGSPTARG